MSGDKATATKIQELYTRVELDLSEINNDIKTLEQIFYSLNPVFENIEDRLARLVYELEQKNAPIMRNRLIKLRAYITNLKKTRGYSSHEFSTLFDLTRLALKKAPEEILPARVVDILKAKIERAHRRTLERKMQYKKNLFEKGYRFLMIKNGNMNFLLAFRKILVKQETEISRKVFITVDNEEKQKKTIEAKLLPGDDNLEDMPTKKIAIGYYDISGSLGAYLTDSIEGKLYMKPALMAKKIETDSAGQKDAFIILKGKRYYIKPEEKTIAALKK